jgi:hypothetical protein
LLILFCAALSALMILSIDLYSFSLGRKKWSRFIFSFLMFYSQIIVTEFLLGSLSIINSKTLSVLNIFIACLLLIYVQRKNSKGYIRKYFKSWNLTFKDSIENLKSDPLFTALLLLGLGFIAWVILLGVLFPATDFDGNSYHLTFIANVIQNHNFFDAPTSLTWLAGYPKGGEFIQMWSAIIARNDMFTDLTQLPFVALGIYALYNLCVTLGADKKNARFSALLFLFVPVVLNQLKTTYVDVMLCTLFFASMAIILKKKMLRADYILLGITYSLIISIKSTGFLFVLSTLPLLAWTLYSDNVKGHKKPFLNLIKPLPWIIAPTIFGLYWYIKDFVLYGSPIYPFGFKLLGKSVFPGQTFQDFAAGAVSQLKDLPSGCTQRIWFVWTEQKDWYGCLYNYDTNYAGLGPIWFIILIPAIILCLYYGFKKRNFKLLAVGASIIGLFVIYPTNYYSRYTMFIISLGIISLSIVLSSLNNKMVPFIKAFVVLIALSVLATNFVLCNFPPRTVTEQLKSVLSGSERGAIYSNMPGKAFVFIEQTVKPKEVIVYDSSPYFIYPLWNPDFSNEVKYVPAQNVATWNQGLKDNKAKYVFTTIGSKENLWAKNEMMSIYKDEMYEVFKTN